MSGYGSPRSAPVPVVLLLEDLDYGGTQRQTLDLAARLDKACFEPRLVTLRKGNMDLAAQAKRLGLPCQALVDSEVFTPLRALPALWRYLRRERPLLLHLLTALPNIWGRILGKILRVPGIIGSCRGLSALRNQHEVWLKNLADVHICNAAIIREQLVHMAGLPEERVCFIPNGVDADFFIPPERYPNAPVVLCVARMAEVKNHPLLLQAFARVLAVFPEASLHLVGEGETRARILKLAASPALRGRVTLHPGTDDVRPFLRAAQIFVLPSDQEGTPNAILEAMACALPVIATRAGGSAEAVCHEKTGLLTPCGDPEALAEAMLRLLSRPEERAAFGRAGRELVLERYSMPAMARAHEAVYDRTLHAQ